MTSVSVSSHFDAAHFLADYPGKCRNIHGHRFTVHAKLSGELQKSGGSRGMVVDFGDAKRALNTICDRFDHTLIYEKGTLSDNLLAALRYEDFALSEVDFRPTAENFSKFIYDELKKSNINRDCTVVSVSVFETPDNSATYEENSL